MTDVDQDFKMVEGHRKHCPYWTPHQTAALARIREAWERRDTDATMLHDSTEVFARENAALRAENALLRHAAEQVKNPEYVKALDQAGVEYVEQLVAEVERLREALEKAERRNKHLYRPHMTGNVDVCPECGGRGFVYLPYGVRESCPTCAGSEALRAEKGDDPT